MGALPSMYLGMPLGSNIKVKRNTGLVLEKSERKLSKWKA